MTPEENEMFTRVGRGTPAGEMLRRYWWPVWFSELVVSRPVPVRILGEDLILFRDATGETGLLDRRCPHRGASLELGRVEADGIRCCYHGWKFDRAGRCLDMPAEPENTPLKGEVRQTAYMTQEAGGLVFAYLGPRPAPLLPKYDLLFR
jgi:5,5'-dehydrodivanillate O-demethylase oxygenase subunit